MFYGLFFATNWSFRYRGGLIQMKCHIKLAINIKSSFCYFVTILVTFFVKYVLHVVCWQWDVAGVVPVVSSK